MLHNVVLILSTNLLELFQGQRMKQGFLLLECEVPILFSSAVAIAVSLTNRLTKTVLFLIEINVKEKFQQTLVLILNKIVVDCSSMVILPPWARRRWGKVAYKVTFRLCPFSFLHCKWCAGRVTRRWAADSRIRLVFTSVTSHLSDSTTSAEKGTAQIFTPMTVLFWNRILPSDALASAAKTVQRPNGKQKTSHGFQDQDEDGRIAWSVVHGRNFQRRRIDHVGNHQKYHHFEGVLCGNFLSGLTEPREWHSRHDLRHCNPSTEKGAAKRRMANSQRKAIEKPVFPFSRRRFDAIGVTSVRHRRQKGLALFDSTFGHFTNERTAWIVVQICFEGISLRKSGRCSHGDHKRLHFLFILVGVLLIACRRHGRNSVEWY